VYCWKAKDTTEEASETVDIDTENPDKQMKQIEPLDEAPESLEEYDGV